MLVKIGKMTLRAVVLAAKIDFLLNILYLDAYVVVNVKQVVKWLVTLSARKL